jgi:hypothetical protein
VVVVGILLLRDQGVGQESGEGMGGERLPPMPDVEHSGKPLTKSRWVKWRQVARGRFAIQDQLAHGKPCT